jgi:nucleoside-diphosphate-sugar epimerase
MTQTAFVTGGTGFIGINLIELLVREGWKVTALHRPTSELKYLKRFPIDLAEGSITDRDSLEEAIPKNTDVVFHVAGDTNFWSKRNAQQSRNNIDGTRNMVEVAASKGVGAFIHTSSVSAWGRVKGTVTEETPLEGRKSWINYERTKHLGELEALKGVERGMKVVVLNPGGVAGPYDANTWGQLFFMLRDKALPAASPGTTTISHVHDIVAAHRGHPRAKRGAIHLGEWRRRARRADRRSRSSFRNFQGSTEGSAVRHQAVRSVVGRDRCAHWKGARCDARDRRDDECKGHQLLERQSHPRARVSSPANGGRRERQL